MARAEIHAVDSGDREWVRSLIVEHWGEERVLAHGVVYRPHTLPGFWVEGEEGAKTGLLTYVVDGGGCEIVTLNSLHENRGVGTLLIEAVKGKALRAGCDRLWLITTNDNLHALGFYQRRGFRLAAVHRDAVTRSRELKPSIPLFADNGIPLTDEIELELAL